MTGLGCACSVPLQLCVKHFFGETTETRMPRQVSASGGKYDPNVDPGDVNPPGIFEPSADLAGTGKIWAILSGGSN